MFSVEFYVLLQVFSSTILGMHMHTGDPIHVPANGVKLSYWPTGGDNMSKYAEIPQQKQK